MLCCYSSRYCHKIPDRSKLNEEGFKDPCLLASGDMVCGSREGKDRVASARVAAVVQNLVTIRQRAQARTG